MARTDDLRRPSWWGPDWLRLPVAFWLSVLTGVGIMGALVEVLFTLLLPSLFQQHGPNSGLLASGDYYAALLSSLGALPPLQLWSRALHRRGLPSWDD